MINTCWQKRSFYIIGIRKISHTVKLQGVRKNIPPTYAIILRFAITLVYLQHELYWSHRPQCKEIKSSQYWTFSHPKQQYPWQHLGHLLWCWPISFCGNLKAVKKYIMGDDRRNKPTPEIIEPCRSLQVSLLIFKCELLCHNIIKECSTLQIYW